MNKTFTFTVPGSISVFTANTISLRNTIDGKLFEKWEVTWINESGTERNMVYDEDELIKLLSVWNAEYKSGWDGFFIKEEKETKALDKQVSGNHYKSFKIQPAEYNHANNIGFLEGNVIKYVSRYRNKNGKKDLEKAIHCIEILIQLEYPDE